MIIICRPQAGRYLIITHNARELCCPTLVGEWCQNLRLTSTTVMLPHIGGRMVPQFKAHQYYRYVAPLWWENGATI